VRLHRLYSDKPHLFDPVDFNDGLSVVLAEIRVPANQDLDTHNLGKSTVGELLDFCLLKGKDADFFLFKHAQLFSSFAFYLELKLGDQRYLTIRRRVDPGSRIEFKRSGTPIEDATRLSDDGWDHYDLPLERARVFLDGELGFSALSPWKFRKLVGYLIRSQKDYLDVFQLRKFSGKHQDWKPFVAHLMGMQAQPVVDLYAKKTALEDTKTKLSALTQEWGGDEIDPSLLDGLISVKRRDVEAKQAALEEFSFRSEDQRTTADVVERVDIQIAALNEERYRLNQLLERIDKSLSERKISFDPQQAEALFAEAGVAFGEQLKQDYEQLIRFNRAITQERRSALKQQRKDADSRVREIETALADLNAQRTRSLSFLRETDSLAKFKELSRELSSLQAALATLEAKRAAAARLIELRQERRTLDEEFGHVQTAVERELVEIGQDETSRFALIRRFFTEIVFEVLGENAVLAISMNSQGGLDFRAEFVGEKGVATSGDRGTSYRKLLCIAFDLAVLRAHLDTAFPRFVYHDGALEQLEPRKREKLIGVFRSYAGHGLQPALSLLNSDLPAPLDSSPSTLATDDIVLTLHDEGEAGRLFKMPEW